MVTQRVRESQRRRGAIGRLLTAPAWAGGWGLKSKPVRALCFRRSSFLCWALPKRPVAVLLLCLGIAAPAAAQKAFSLVATQQVHGYRYVFADRALVNSRLLFRPTLSFASTLAIRYGITPRLSLEAGLGLFAHKLSVASVADYPGGRRFETVRISSLLFNSPQVHGVLLYRTVPSVEGHVWLLETGGDVISRRYTVLPDFVNRLSSNTGQPSLYLRGTNQPRGASILRFGLRGGVGREWHVVNTHFLGVKLVGSLGLQELIRYQLAYTYTEEGVSKSYDNRIRTRLGYVGLQTWYRFQW